MSIFDSAFAGLKLTPVNTVSNFKITDHVEDNDVHDIESILDANFFLGEAINQLFKYKDVASKLVDPSDEVVKAHLGIMETISKTTLCYSEVSIDMESKEKSLSQKYDLLIQKIILKIEKVITYIANYIKSKFGYIVKQYKVYLEIKDKVKNEKSTSPVKLSKDEVVGVCDNAGEIDFKWIESSAKHHDLSNAEAILSSIYNYVKDYIGGLDDQLDEQETDRSIYSFKFNAVVENIFEFYKFRKIDNNTFAGHVEPGVYLFKWDTVGGRFSVSQKPGIKNEISEVEVSRSDIIDLFNKTADANFKDIVSRYNSINKKLNDFNDYVFKEIKDSKNSAKHFDIAKSISNSIYASNKALSMVTSMIDYTGKLYGSINKLGKAAIS